MCARGEDRESSTDHHGDEDPAVAAVSSQLDIQFPASALLPPLTTPGSGKY